MTTTKRAACSALCLACLAVVLTGCGEGADRRPAAVVDAIEGERLLDVGLLREGALLIESAASAVASDPPGSLDQVRVMSSLGRLHLFQQDLEAAVEVWERALEIVEHAAPDGPEHATLLDLMGGVALRRDEVDAAGDLFRRAYEMRRARSREEIDLVPSYERLSQWQLARGDLLRAERWLRLAQSALEAEPEESLELAAVYHGLGLIERQRARRDLAAELYGRALEIRRRLAPDSPKYANSLRAVAGITLERGNVTPAGLERARSHYQETIDLWHRHEDRFDSPVPLIQAFAGLGKVALAARDGKAAIEHLETAVALADEHPEVGRDRQIVQLIRLSESYTLGGRPADSRAALERALELAEAARPGGAEHVQILGYLAFISGSEGDHHAARELYAEALGWVEAMLGRIGGGDDALATLLARFHSIYLGAMATEARLGSPEGALDIVESYRARSFLARISERDLLAVAGEEAHLELQLRELSREFDRVRLQLSSDELSDARRESLLGEERRLQERQLELSEAVRRESPQLAAIRYPETMRSDEIRELLHDGTAMISYFVAGRRTGGFLVTRDGVELVRIPVGRRELLQLVTRWRHLVVESAFAEPDDTDSGAELAEVSGELYRLLIDPFEEAIERSRRILVVPDASLHLLPFAALRAPDGRYLIERRPLHVALSASVYGLLHETREPERMAAAPESGGVTLTFAGFADPLFDPAALPVSIGQGGAGRGLRTRGDGALAPLPYSASEVARIAALYPPDAVAHVGREATEARAKALLPRAEVLHFATHGLLDERRPLDSALVLSSPLGAVSGADNGLLQAWEIVQAGRIRSELVVLSACRSGLGADAGGEGLIGLTRAFQYAGVPSVVASLWDVADQTTAELMVGFYGYLNDGLSTADALRRAQLDLLRGQLVFESNSGEPLDATSPYFWAPFQLYGDWR